MRCGSVAWGWALVGMGRPVGDQGLLFMFLSRKINRGARVNKGIQGEEHKKHSSGCGFLSVKKHFEELTLSEFLKLDKERAKNKIVRIVGSENQEQSLLSVLNPKHWRDPGFLSTHFFSPSDVYVRM